MGALVYIFRITGWLGAVILIGFTADALKNQLNDVIYVFNSLFLLLGGKCLGDIAVQWMKNKWGHK